jgi:cobalt-zinc-cadmium efflux system outer membrane protein
MSRPRFLLVLPLALALFNAEAGAAPLTLAQALQQAVQTYPALAAQQARLDAARQAAIPAAELPDPRLAIGIDNFPVSGPTAGSLTDDFMTMQRIGVMQEVPNADKRRARRESAEARVAQAGAEQQAVQRAVRRDTALAWINRLTAEKKLAQFAQLEQENRLLAEAVRARIAGGQARVEEAVMPKQEALKLADQRDELRAQQQQASAALQRWLGHAADEPLDAAWPAWPVERSALQARLHQHPELAVFAPREQVLAAEVREAEAAKYPDWGVALAYQRRGQQYGDMVSAELSFDLPVFAASRQDPRIAEKQAERVGLEAEREDMLRQHTEELERDLAEYERLERAVNRQRDALLPLLSGKLDLLLASYRAGKTGLAEVIAARAESQAARLQLIELEGQRSMAAARLHFAYGEDAE